MSEIDNIDVLLEALQKSKFRSRFTLKQKEKDYITEKGMDTIQRHAMDFVETRLSLIDPNKDGKQTPMRGHPVFIAQHATATCCRGCLMKWHHIPKGRELSLEEKKYIVCVIMRWIEKEYRNV